MKIKECKQKGRNLVKKIRKMLLEAFPSVSEYDIKIPTTSAPGEDLWLSERARSWFPFSVEAKCQQKLNIYAAFEQAKRNADIMTPIVVFSRNHEDVYVMLRFKDFLYSLKADR